MLLLKCLNKKLNLSFLFLIKKANQKLKFFFCVIIIYILSKGVVKWEELRKLIGISKDIGGNIC